MSAFSSCKSMIWSLLSRTESRYSGGCPLNQHPKATIKRRFTAAVSVHSGLSRLDGAVDGQCAFSVLVSDSSHTLRYAQNKAYDALMLPPSGFK
eukprot:scaffold138438_cov20-Prasinocladus_malaysianus.AAC.1